jgi:hypothetical protein
MSNLQLSEETLQSLLNYLATRPYREVHELVPLVQDAQPISEVKEKACTKCKSLCLYCQDAKDKEEAKDEIKKAHEDIAAQKRVSTGSREKTKEYSPTQDDLSRSAER